MKKSSMIKWIIFGVCLFIISAIIITSGNDMFEIFEIIKTMDPLMLGLAIVCLLIYWGFLSLSLMTLMNRSEVKISNIDNFLVSGSELFFNGITPYQSGGQPFQLYSYARLGIPSSDVTGSLLSTFAISQFQINTISAISLAIFGAIVAPAVDGFMWLVIIGFSINMTTLTFLILTGCSKRFANKIIAFVGWLGRRRLFKKLLANKEEQTRLYVEDVQNTFQKLVKNPSILFRANFHRLASLLAYYALPYFILLAVDGHTFENSFQNFWFIVALSAFNFTFVSYLPSPGGSLGAEIGFISLFVAIGGINQATAASVMLVWRFLTYYLSLIYGFTLYFIFERRLKKNENRNIHGHVPPAH